MMQRKAFITQTAEDDLVSAVRYIALSLCNQTAAKKLLDEFETTLGKIVSGADAFPFVRDEIARASGYRWTQIGNYTVFFLRIDEHEDDIVVIERIAYKKRNWQSLIG